MLQDAGTEALGLNLRHLRAALLIAREGSIRAAAATVGMSQPALTQGVARLEAQFGAPLFERLPRGLRPTDAGRAALHRVERAMAGFAVEMRRAAGAAPARGGRAAENRLTASMARAVIAVAEAGSLSAAAAALGLSEPAVHRAVRDLEAVCGTALTERRGRRVCLTEAGHAMAAGMALAARELEEGLRAVAAQPARLGIGAMALSRSMLVPVTLAELSRASPWAEIDVADGSYGELVGALRSGTIDVVIGALRDRTAPDLRQEVLLEDRITIIGRSGHPLAAGAPSLAELATFPWIVGRRNSALLERWRGMFDEAGIARPRAPIGCGSVTTIRGLLVRSDFLTLLSRDQVEAELEGGLLIPIPSPMPDTPRSIGAITRRDWIPSALGRDFLAILREVAGRRPSG